MQRFFGVPDTWEAWAIRVLTVCIALMFVACAVLINKLGDMQEFITDSREQRIQFQGEESARQCAMLRQLRVTPSRLEELKC